MKNKFYITTPIYYVNDKPHLGHVFTTLAADILSRWHRLLGENTFFLTGTDEHGAKIEEIAKKMGLPPKKFTDQISESFKQAFKKMDINYDFFIRTTDPKHEDFVKKFIKKVYDKGYIYKDKYEGLYCIGCEKYLTESEMVNGKCPLHPNREPAKMSEDNYFFKLSEFRDRIIRAIENPKDKDHFEILPIERKNEVLSRLGGDVRDLSISRANVKWGIEVPWDKSQTIYVWFDALPNYISALDIVGQNKLWPADMHLMAKEILWFHAVIWPAMLMAADMKMPKKIFAHGWWTVDGMKMSKSLGNVIDPVMLAERYGVDAVRYYIFREMVLGQDGDFSKKEFINRINGDLADGIGNLVNRVVVLIGKMTGGVVENSADAQSSKRVKELVKMFSEKMGEMKLNIALEELWKYIGELNKYITEEKIWEIKDEKAKKKVAYRLYESLRVIAVLTSPFMPSTSMNILNMLDLGEDELKEENLYFGKVKVGKVTKGDILFKKFDNIETKKEQPKEMETELIDIDYFRKVKLRVAKIIEAEKVEGSDKLLKIKVDLGSEKRQIVAGIAKNYEPKKLVGKQVIIVANLKPAKLKGIESQGMLLAAEDDKNNVVVLTVEKEMDNGSLIH